jgi:hypothetical protein
MRSTEINVLMNRWNKIFQNLILAQLINKLPTLLQLGNRGSSVGVVVRVRAGMTDESWFDYGQGKAIFRFSKASRPVLWPTQCPF